MSGAEEQNNRVTHLQFLHIFKYVLRVLRDHCRVELVDLIVEVLLNGVKFTPIALGLRGRDLRPDSRALRQRFLVLTLGTLVLVGRKVFTIAELGKLCLIYDVLLHGVDGSMVLDIHVVFMSDNIVDDNLGNRRVLRDGDTTR